MFENLVNEKGQYKNLLNGKWVESSLQYIEIFCPVDGSPIGEVEALQPKNIDEISKSSREAFLEWKNTPENERSKILHKAADLLEEHAEEVAKKITVEVAKDHKSALSEVTRTVDFIRFTAESGQAIMGETLEGDLFPGFGRSKMSMVVREPLGVVLAISPFNYPVNLAASKIAPALIAGNTVIFKPATQGAIAGLYLAEIFRAAGLPDGVLNTVTGRGSDIGDYTVTQQELDFINFTGSTKVGQHISKLVEMKPVLMELGGKDSAIILEDVDLAFAASNIVAGGFSYSGQRCTAVKRILVEESVADQLIEELIPLASKLKVGNPLNEDVDIVPLIDTKAADFVDGLIADAKEKGAKVLLGGNREGNTIYPTIFDNVTEDMRIAWEEPFGPVIPIIRVKNVDEAIRISNKSEYGLQGAVFTQNIDSAFYVANRLEVGTVQINNKTERGPDHFPFLGIKNSGIGTQGIKYSIEAMTRPKSIVINLKK